MKGVQNLQTKTRMLVCTMTIKRLSSSPACRRFLRSYGKSGVVLQPRGPTPIDFFTLEITGIDSMQSFAQTPKHSIKIAEPAILVAEATLECGQSSIVWHAKRNQKME